MSFAVVQPACSDFSSPTTRPFLHLPLAPHGPLSLSLLHQSCHTSAPCVAHPHSHLFRAPNHFLCQVSSRLAPSTAAFASPASPLLGPSAFFPHNACPTLFPSRPSSPHHSILWRHSRFRSVFLRMIKSSWPLPKKTLHSQDKLFLSVFPPVLTNAFTSVAISTLTLVHLPTFCCSWAGSSLPGTLLESRDLVSATTSKPSRFQAIPSASPHTHTHTLFCACHTACGSPLSREDLFPVSHSTPFLMLNLFFRFFCVSPAVLLQTTLVSTSCT